MGKPLPPITTRGIHRGMAYDGTVADSLMPPEQVRLLRNMETTSIGQLIRTKGYATLGGGQVTSGSNAILGIHYHKPVTAANQQLIYFKNNAAGSTAEAYYLDSGSWTNKALSFTASTRIRATTFLGYVIAVNGTDTPKSWTGATGAAWGSTLLTSVPQGDLIETFRQQVYIASTSTDQVNFSSVPSGGSITWPATNNFLLNPNDGSNLRAMRRLNNELVLLKYSYLYRYNGRALDPDPVIPFGTTSQEATTVLGGTLYFYDENRRSIMAYSGGYPQEISKPVRPLLEALSVGTNVYAWSGFDFIEFFIGSTTPSLTNETFTNCALRYIPSLQTWIIRTTPDAFSAFSPYNGGFVSGSSTGSAFTMESGNTMNTAPIDYEIRTQWRIPTSNPTMNLRLDKIATFVENSGSLTTFYQTDRTTNWQQLGNMNSYRHVYSGLNADFYRTRFRWTGYSDAQPTIFDGYSMLLMDFEGVENDSATKFVP